MGTIVKVRRAAKWFLFDSNSQHGNVSCLRKLCY